MQRVVYLVVSVLMAASTVLSACGGGQQAKPATTTPPTSSAKPQTTAPATTARPSETKPAPTTTAAAKPASALYGGTIAFGIPQDMQGFDDGFSIPYNNFSMHLTNPNLLKGKWQAGPAGTNEIDWQVAMPVPLKLMDGWIAENWTMPDDQTLIFTIRKGIKWENKPPVNGRELIADDVTFTLSRMFAPETAGNYVERQHPDKHRPISFRTVDKYTVETKWPKGELSVALRDMGYECHIIAPEVIKQYGDCRDWKVGVGCGPFILKEYISGNSATLAKNPDYWEKDPMRPGNKLPYVDAFKFIVMTDKSTLIASLRTAKLDVYYAGPSQGLFTYSDADSLKKQSTQLEWASWASWLPDFIYFKMDKLDAPFAKLAVRQALSMAINRKEIADTYYGGQAEIFSYPVSPIIKDVYIPLNKSSALTQKLYSFNADEAKKMLASAGYPNGFKTKIVCSKDHIQMLSVVKDYWAKVGVDLALDVKENSVYESIYSKVGAEELMYRYCNMAQPDKFAAWRPKTTGNQSCIDDAEMNKLYDYILANAWEEEKWKKAFQEKMDYVNEQCWMIQMPVPRMYACWQPWVNDYKGYFDIGYHAGGRYLWAQYAWVDPVERKAAGF